MGLYSKSTLLRFLYPFKFAIIKTPRLKPVFFFVVIVHEGVRGTYILTKQNPKANHNVLAFLFKHVFQETNRRIRIELFYWIFRIGSVVEAILPHNLETGNKKL